MSDDQNNPAPLTEEQKTNMVNEWNGRKDNPPSLKEVIDIAYPGKNLDGRTKEGKLVKEFLGTVNMSATPAHEYQPKPEVVLDDGQKEFCINHGSTMRAHEITRVIFADNELSHMSQECRAVIKYLDEVKETGALELFEDNDDDASVNYKPPKTFDRMLVRINKYINPAIDKNKLTSRERKEIESLISYINTYRLIHIMNTYDSITDRELYESSFIRYTYNKIDLRQEEVDQYIVLSAEVVISSNIQRRVETLQTLLDEAASSGDGESTRISMSLVEAINTAQTEYNQCVNRQQKLLDSLKEKRSDRLSKQIKENASILNLVQMWKDEDSRVKLLAMAELRKKSLAEEVEKLTTMDEVKARIMGLSEDDALNG